MLIEEEHHINKAKNGDSNSFAFLVKKYQQMAYNLAFRIVCDEDDAKDVVQESFIKIWKNMKRYDSKAKFSTWMYTIVTNTAIDYLRTTKKRAMINIDNLGEKLSDTNMENELENEELGQIIKMASDGLTTKQRLVFVLRDLQGLKSEEVGEILKLSSTSIKSNLYHARNNIREKIQHLIT